MTIVRMRTGSRRVEWKHTAESVGVAVTFTGLAFGFEQQAKNWVPESMVTRICLWGCLLVVAVAAALAVRFLLGRHDPSTKVFRKPHKGKLASTQTGAWLLTCLGLDYGARCDRFRDEIRRYLLSALEDQSSATIVTRDLSWASESDPEIERLCQAGKLSILACDEAPSQELVRKLQVLAEHGAEVHLVPVRVNVRMTVYEKGGHQTLAFAKMGSPDGDHVIKHFYDSRSEALSIATALISALRQVPSTSLATAVVP